MKKLLIIMTAMIFMLTFSVNPAMADRWHGHGGGGYYHGHYGYGLGALAIGLGAAIVGSVLLNTYPREHVVVEHEPYYPPYAAPQYRGGYDTYPGDYDGPPPGRIWVPGHYFPDGYGRYTYVPGHWEN